MPATEAHGRSNHSRLADKHGSRAGVASHDDSRASREQGCLVEVLRGHVEATVDIGETAAALEGGRFGGRGAGSRR